MKRIKFILVFLLLLTLTGCSFDATMSEQMDQGVNAVLEEDCSEVRNNTKEYYSYYLQPCVGKRESTALSNTFALEDDEFVMNLNVSSVVKNKYYSEIDSKIPVVYSRSKTQVYNYEGQITNSDHELMNFVLNIYELGKNRYLVELDTDYFTFLAKVPLGSVVQIGQEMLRIARTAIIHADEILSDYGLSEVVTYQKQKVEIIQQVIPEEGLLEDIIPISEVEESSEESSEESNEQGE